jgi:phosphatidate cytidylyltransferase
MLRRILSALLLIPIVLGAIVCPWSWVFKFLISFCLALALHEYFSMVWPKVKMSYRVLATLYGFCIALLLTFGCDALPVPCGRSRIILMLIPLTVMLGLLAYVLRGRVKDAHDRVPQFLFGIAYIIGLGLPIAWLRDFPGWFFWIFALLAATWLNDTGAYFAGRTFGKHQLNSKVSPGKTWEGCFGGFVGSSCGVFWAWYAFSNPLELQHLFVLIGIASIFGPLGDLSESLLKRAAHVKDSGKLIPGHGGVLDRIDALLFNAPWFYCFALWIEPHSIACRW